jgi:tetratricopeptide (TPR) repeat protein
MEHAPEEEAPFVVQQLISAYCSVAEIFMTDECFDPNAEQECGNALQAALKIDPNNYEALQTMASYKVSQQNPEEALNYLRQSFEKWKDITDPVDFPEFEFRVQTAKLFMELGDFRQAADILEALLNEDDEISELWYLLGFALVPLEPQSSLQCLTKARELLVKTNCTEREIFQQVDEQIKRVTEILEEIKAQGGDQVVEDAEMDAGEDDDFEGDGNQ